MLDLYFTMLHLCRQY